MSQVLGKGERKKSHKVAVNAPTRMALRAWRPQREQIVAGLPASVDRPTELLVARNGKPLTRQAAYGTVSWLAEAARVGKLTPHGLRATMVTLALGQGMPLRDVQDSARHADPRTTRRYDRDRGSLNRSAPTGLLTLRTNHEG